MLIYLDTSQFAALERLREETPSRFESFVEMWTRHGHELALSLNHAQELAQLADERSRQRRLDVVSPFPTGCIRFAGRGAVGIQEIEIVNELSGLAGRRQASIEECRQDLWAQTFGEFCESVTENVNAFHEGLKFRNVFAEGLNDSAGIGREMESLRREYDLPRFDLEDPDLDWEKMWSVMESLIPKDAEESPAGRTLVGSLRRLHELVGKHRSMRGGLEELYALQDMEITKSLHSTDLNSAALVFASAREQSDRIAGSLGLSRKTILDLIANLNPYRMPGVSLGIAISRARQLSGVRAETGDLIDDSHIAFAPYVDLLFVDRRTFAFLNQEVRDRPELLVPPPDERVRFAGTVAHLEDELGFQE